MQTQLVADAQISNVHGNSAREKSQPIFRFIQSYSATGLRPILLATPRRFATVTQVSKPLFDARMDL
jgi:hypothetical protein